MQLSQPTLEPHSLCYTCWVQVVYSRLPTQLFFSCSLWGHPTAAQLPAMRRSSPGATRSTRTSRLSSPSRRPCGALLPSFVLVLYFRILCIRHFVIYVINNIRTRFIISFTWYVLWYIVHSVVYTCDLILARIWLLGLCSFINRMLQKRSLNWSQVRDSRSWAAQILLLISGLPWWFGLVLSSS